MTCINSTACEVWDAIAACLSGLNQMMETVGGEPYAKFSNFASNIVKSAFLKVGWDGLPDDGHQEKLLRSTIIGNISVN